MRPSVIVVSTGMLAVCGGLLYLNANRDERVTTTRNAMAQPLSAERPVLATTHGATAELGASDDGTDTTATAPSSDIAAGVAAPSPAAVEQWIKDTQDIDPKIRAAAIANLANATAEQAIPALTAVVDGGEPEVDRHIALRSLHAIALRDGDRSGEIREVMRRAIYHSDNDGVTQTAQSLLDDVEAAFDEQPPPP